MYSSVLITFYMEDDVTDLEDIPDVIDKDDVSIDAQTEVVR